MSRSVAALREAQDLGPHPLNVQEWGGKDHPQVAITTCSPIDQPHVDGKCCPNTASSFPPLDDITDARRVLLSFCHPVLVFWCVYISSHLRATPGGRSSSRCQSPRPPPPKQRSTFCSQPRGIVIGRPTGRLARGVVRIAPLLSQWLTMRIRSRTKWKRAWSCQRPCLHWQALNPYELRHSVSSERMHFAQENEKPVQAQMTTGQPKRKQPKLGEAKERRDREQVFDVVNAANT